MRMLETGADDRTLGEAHPLLAAARLDAERELLAELRDEGLSGAALTARCADALATFQSELADAYDDASERVVELHEAFDDCGGLSAAEWRAFEADFAAVDAPPAAAGISDGEASHLPLLRFLGGASPGADAARPPTPPISGALCRQCHRPGVVAPLARVSDEMREALEGLCAVCAAETELAASNALVRTTDGRLVGGADGFNGWTSGLKRSRDPKALKRMYKADTLKQLEALDEAELEVPGGLEIEEIAPCDDLNGADDGGDGSTTTTPTTAACRSRWRSRRREWIARSSSARGAPRTRQCPTTTWPSTTRRRTARRSGALSTRARCAAFPSSSRRRCTPTRSSASPSASTATTLPRPSPRAAR